VSTPSTFHGVTLTADRSVIGPPPVDEREPVERLAGVSAYGVFGVNRFAPAWFFFSKYFAMTAFATGAAYVPP
jgi:hypothetical protein